MKEQHADHHSLKEPGRLEREPSTESPLFSIIIILVIFLVFPLMRGLFGPIAVGELELIDTDSYTRLNRVQWVYEHGHWNQGIFPRSNVPYGESIHWTKPLDFLLLAGALVMTPFVPFSQGLHWWAVIVSPLLHFLAFLGLFSLMRKDLNQVGLMVLLIGFLLQPALTEYFSLARPDHHSLILAVFCWLVCLAVKGLYEDETPTWKLFFTGGLAALGLWISVEFLIALAFLLGIFSLKWVRVGGAEKYRNVFLTVGLFMFLGLFLFIERVGEPLFVIEYDRLSIVHITVMGCLAGMWMIVIACERQWKPLTNVMARLVILGIGGAGVMIGMWNLFPEFFKGPLADMDPELKALLWDRVGETQPLVNLRSVSFQFLEVFSCLGIAGLALPFLFSWFWTKKHMWSREQVVVFLVGAGIFIPLALYERRWTPYAELVLLVPYVTCLVVILEWVEIRWTYLGKGTIALLLGLGFLFGPRTIEHVLAKDPKHEMAAVTGSCSINKLSKYLAEDEFSEGKALNILTHINYGPELLYRTSHHVVGTPMHRNAQGVKDIAATMTATDLRIAEKIIKRRHVDLLLICPRSKVEATYFQAESETSTLWTQLVDNVIPPWLHPIPLPDDLQESFNLYRVIYTDSR